MAQSKKKQIAFCMTNKCNLNCSYCYTSSAKDINGYNFIDVDFALSLLHDYLPNSNFGVRFYAVGEPTINIDGIKKIAECAESLKPDVEFEIQTNGFFSNETAEWISDFCSTVWLSIDGPSDIHDLQRPTKSGDGSLERIIESVKIIQKNKKTKVGGRATITSLNLYRLRDIIDFYKELNLDFGYSKPAFKPQGIELTPKGTSIDVVGLEEYSKKYVDAYYYGMEKDFFFGSFLTVNFDSKCDRFCRSANALPYATLDGYVSSCDESYYFTEEMKSLFIGKYDQEKQIIEYWNDQIEKLKSRTIHNTPECKTCQVRDNCGGQCLAASIFENRDMFSVRSDVCKAVKFLAEKLPLNNKPFPCFFP